MGSIIIDGLGQVDIQGDAPNKEEEKSIIEALDAKGQVSMDGAGTDTTIPKINNANSNQETPLRGLEYIGGRPTFEATGAIFGGAIGSPATPAGMVAGGTLGAAGMGQLYDVVQGYLTDDPSNMKTQFSKAKTDLSREAVLQSFFTKLPGLGKSIKGMFVSKDPQAKQLYDAAKRMNYPLSFSDTGNRVAKGYGRVIGIFPYVGSPIKKQLETKAKLLNKYADDTLNSFAPNITLTNLGVDMVEASKSTYGNFRRISNFFYDDFYKTAGTIKAPIVPTKNFQNDLKRYVNLVDEGVLQVNKKNINSPQKDSIYNYAKSLLKIDPTININQYKSLIKDMQVFAKQSSKEGYDLKVITGFKGALEKDLSLLGNQKYLDSFKKVLNPNQMKAIRDKLLFANKVYINGLENSIITSSMRKEAAKSGVKLTETVGKKTFQSPTAKKFERVDKNIFSAGFDKPGSINADQIGEMLLKNRANLTPQVLTDLESLVGKKAYKKFTRSFFEKSYQGSLVSSKEGSINGLVFDPSKFERALGLNTTQGREILEKMLQGSKLNIQKIDDFFAIAKNHVGLNIPDVSSFVARRATLGGVRSLVGTGTMGLSVMTNPVASLGAIYISRRGSSFLSNPKQLDDVMTVMDYKAPAAKMKTATLKLIDGLLSDKNTPNEEKRAYLEYKDFFKKLPLKDFEQYKNMMN